MRGLGVDGENGIDNSVGGSGDVGGRCAITAILQEVKMQQLYKAPIGAIYRRPRCCKATQAGHVEIMLAIRKDPSLEWGSDMAFGLLYIKSYLIR